MLELETSPEINLYLAACRDPLGTSKYVVLGPAGDLSPESLWGPGTSGLGWQMLAAAVLPACLPHRWAGEAGKLGDRAVTQAVILVHRPGSQICSPHAPFEVSVPLTFAAPPAPTPATHSCQVRRHIRRVAASCKLPG